MGTVVELPKPARLVWLCAECQCATFYLYNDNTCECAGCGFLSGAGEWVTPLQDKPARPEKDDGASINVIQFDSEEYARRRVLKKITDNRDDIRLVAAWFGEGGLSVWCDAQTPEQRDWTVRKLREMADSYAMTPDDHYKES